MKFEIIKNPDKFDYHTPEDEARFAELIAEDGACSLFLYSRNVLTKDGIVSLDPNDKKVRTIARNGVMFVPASFFERFLGVRVESGEEYLPLISTCAKLCIFAKTYNDGLLAVVGGVKLDAEIKTNQRLIYAGGYATLGKYDATKFTSADYKEAKNRWIETIVGSPEINDMSIPEIKEKIEEAERKYEEARAIFHRDPEAVILFGDKPPTDSIDLKTQYDHLASFAIAWAMPGSKYKGDAQILSDVLFGLEWMYLHMYGEAEIEERGWRSAHLYDWWHWYVGGPESLTDIMFLVEDYLTMELKRKYLKCFWWVVSFERQGYYQDYATSRIRVCTKGALLLEDAEWMETEFYDYELLNDINEDGEGVHIDFINWTHNYPYNFIYGNNNLCRVLFVGSVLGGTPLEFTSPRHYNLYRMAKYTFEPLLYHGRGSAIFAGRCVGAEFSRGITTVAQLLPMIGLYGEDEDEHIKRIIKRNSQNPEVIEGVKRECQLRELKKYVDILRDPSVPYENDYEIGYSYFTGDRAVQQRNDYAFTVALCSTRHVSYESINGSNRIAWYSGDGALYLSTANDNHTFDHFNFFSNEKVMMNVPGTTVDTQKRIPWSHRVGIKGLCDFVGSLAVGEKFVTATMDYHGYDFHGETSPDIDKDYGGGYLQHSCDLVAKKSYFLLDKECVCLGAGISCTTAYPVKTIVEDRCLVACEGDKVGVERTTVDSRVLPTDDFEEVMYPAASYASIEGVGGYVLLGGADISVEKFSETEYHSYFNREITDTIVYDTPHRFFKVCIEHGANPTDATYAYATIPYATEEQLSAYAKCPEVEIISNTKECQALRKSSIGFASYVFHSAGACEDIEVSAPCIVTVYKEQEKVTVSVCDPTMKLESVEVKIAKGMKLSSADERVSVTEGEKTLININTVRSVGRPYTAIFE